jgi:chromosome segregation ATPase
VICEVALSCSLERDARPSKLATEMKSATTQMLENLEGAVGGNGDAASPCASDGSRKRVLLIEDEPATRLVLLQKLRSTGFDVDVAVNGKLALEKIRTGHPDAIFMDLLLPRVKGLRGVDVIKAARRDPEFAGRPIYVCTSAALMSVWTRRGTKAGATKVFDRATTPIDAIVAELAADLLGCPSSAKPSAPLPEKTEPEEHPGLPQPVAPRDNKESSPVKSTGRPFNFMKRVAKTFGLDWTKRPASEFGAATSAEPIQSIQAPTPFEPAADSVQDQLSTTDVWPASGPESQPGDADDGELDGLNVPATERGVAVLTLDESAKILSANKTCTGMFGWEGSALVGQNLKFLLKDGGEDDIGKLLQQQRAGDQNKVACPLFTVARKKDGTEFPVSVTTLTWSSDTAIMRRSDSPQFCWTAFIRDMAAGAGSQDQASHIGSAESMVLTTEMSQLQERFAALQQGNEELQQQLQQISAEAALRREDLTRREREREELTGRIFENEVELSQARTELERESEERKQLEQRLQDLRTELETQNTERGRLESEWREQLKCAEGLTKKLEAGWLEEAGRNKNLEERLQIFGNSLRLEQVERSRRFEEEVLVLRNERDQLYGKLSEEQLATEEFKRRTEELETRLRDSAAEAGRVKEELETQYAEQGRLESEWRDKLNTAEGLTSRLEAAWVEAEEQNKRTEEELSSLRQIQDELKGKLAGEQQAAAESGRRNEELTARLIENAAKLERIKAELETSGRNEHFEAQLKALEQVREALRGELKTEQQVTAQSRQRSKELEDRLQENSAELDRVKADADKHAEEQARLESELHTQLDAAHLAASQAEAALKEKSAQCTQFEAQLATLEKLRDELGDKLATEQKAGAESRQRGEELENCLRESVAELDRVKAERDKQVEEQARLESELRAQLEAAKTAAGQAEAALNEQAAQNRAFEERLRLFGNGLRLQQIESTERFTSELSSLQQVRDELGSKLTAEQQAATEARQRGEELENQLRETAAELERVKTELAKHDKERNQQESDQTERLNAAKAATEKAEAACLEEAERRKRFEEELVGLRQEHDQLNHKFTTEQQTVAEARRHSEELENRLRETAGELERVHTELTRHAEEKSQLESHQLTQLDAEKTATEKAEHSKQLEELGKQLRETAAELERVQADLARHAEERADLEAEQNKRLNAAKAATEKAEAAWQEEAERSKRFEKKLAGLRQEHDQLNQKFTTEQQAAAEARRRSEELENQLRETAGELERVHTELTRHAEEQSHLESNQRTQLDAGRTATEKAEAAWLEEAERSKRFEDELAGLRQERDQLNQKFAAEQQAVADSRRHSGELENQFSETVAELGRVRTDLTRHEEERVRSLSEHLAQLNTAKAAVEQAEAALSQKAALCTRFQEEAAGLWRESEELSAKLAAEQQAAAEFKRRSEEFENRICENAVELEGVKASQQQQAEEQKRLEAEWREQLSNAQGSATRAEEALQEGVARQRQLERNLTNLRNERHQVYDKFKAEHAAAEKAKRRIGELQKRLRERATELQHARSELEKQAVESSRQESEWRAQLGTVRIMAERELGSLRQERETLNGRLDESVAELERVKVELEQHAKERTRLETEHRSFTETTEALGVELRHLRESEAAHKADVGEMEGRLAESIALLARVTTELETERSERQRLEQRAASLVAEMQDLHKELQQHLGSEQANEQRIAGLMQQLREREDAVTKVSMDLQKEMLNRQAAEEHLRATADMSDQLRNHFSLIEEAKQVFASRESDLESRLQASLDALREREASVQKEANERRRLEETLQEAQRESQRQGDSNALELSKLKLAMQVEQLERKGLEAQAIQSRYSSLDASRVGAAMVNSFRDRIRQPIDKLMQSARRLLETQLEDEHRKLVESLLENALLLQTSVRESGLSNAGSAGTHGENPRESGDPRQLGLVFNEATGGLQP